MWSELTSISTVIAEPGRHPCFVVAEVAQAHDGSLGIAHSYIDAVADAGADAVKFQTHIAEAESTPAEPWRVRFSEQDATRFDYWRRTEFSSGQWLTLKKHADERNIAFLSSPFSIEAAELLERVGVPAWKVASGEVSNIPLLKRLCASGLPVILSTGVSPLDEIDRAIDVISTNGLPFAVMQCTTEYPTPPGNIGLNMIDAFRDRYGCAVGLSDHSGRIFAGIAAATMGIDLLEVHVTISRAMFGPDTASSVTHSELKQLIEGVRFVEAARDTSVDKDVVAERLTDVRAIFTKGVVAARDLPAGHVLSQDDLALRKPAGDFGPRDLQTLYGRSTATSLNKNQHLRKADLQ